MAFGSGFICCLHHLCNFLGNSAQRKENNISLISQLLLLDSKINGEQTETHCEKTAQ